MSDVFFATGSFDFNGGRASTEHLAYVLSREGFASTVEFQGGTARIYSLGPVSVFASGSLGLGNGSAFISGDPVGAFDAFAIFPEGAPDPVEGFVLANNAGSPTAGVGNTWSRHYAVVLPPKKARFAVPHNRLGSVPAGGSQYFDAHQLEVLRAGQLTPSAFHSARALQVSVRPTRLNYASGSTRVTGLTPGITYTASADVLGERRRMTFTATSTVVDLDFTKGIEGVFIINHADGTSTVRGATVVDNGDGTSNLIGVPSVDNGDGTTSIQADVVTITRILVEEGTVLGDYFDGSFGPDYLWEQGGTPGAARSYFYADRAMRHYVLVRTLQENVPLGMVVEDPVYAVLPAPSSAA